MNLVPVDMTIKEKIQRLMDGEVFYTDCGSNIFYNESVVGSPFRVGDCALNQVFHTQWYQEKQWYDNIPEKGVPCWVWDDSEAEQILRLVVDVRNIKCAFRFLDDSRNKYWNHAQPATKEELFDE